MLPAPREHQQYTRAELRSDAVVHITGITAAAVAAPALVIVAWLWRGDIGTVTAFTVYALSLVAMLVCSALYNMMPYPSWRDRLRRFDQSAIYMKIAGTYTPFGVLIGSHTWMFLAGVWSTAIIGASLVLLGPQGLRRPTFAVYLILGWAGVVAGRPIIEGLSPACQGLVLTAGMLYSVGMLFLLWERLPHHNTVWHVFVLVASAALYGALVIELADSAVVS